MSDGQTLQPTDVIIVNVLFLWNLRRGASCRNEEKEIRAGRRGEFILLALLARPESPYSDYLTIITTIIATIIIITITSTTVHFHTQSIQEL